MKTTLNNQTLNIPTLKQLKSIEGLTAFTDSNDFYGGKNKNEYLSAIYDVLKELRYDPTWTTDCYDYNGSYTDTVTFKRDNILTILDIYYDDINKMLSDISYYLNYKTYNYLDN